MNKYIKMTILIVLSVVQLGFLSFMTYKGRYHRGQITLPVATYDPYDILKGRYLSIRLKYNTFEFKDYEYLRNKIERGQEIYCEYDYEGNVETFYLSYPEEQSDAVIVKGYVQWIYYYDITDEQERDDKFTLRYDFSKYYIQENYAKEAESLLRQEEANPFVTLSVDNKGNSRIEKLTVHGVEIEKYIRRHLKEK